MAKERAGTSRSRSGSRRRPVAPLAAVEETVLDEALNQSLSCVAHLESPALITPIRPTAPGDEAVVMGQFAPGLAPAVRSNAGVDPSSPTPFGAVADLDATWQRGMTLNVAFLDGPADFHRKVKDIVQLWTEAADIKFKFVADRSGAHVRITFQFTNSFSSLLGRESLSAPTDRHTMSLGFTPGTSEAEFRRLILHEFGHAIGFAHEHQNPNGGIQWNLAVAIPYYRQRIQFPGNMSEAQKNQAVLQNLQVLPNSRRYRATAFDGESIMLYKIEPQLVSNFRPEFGNHNTNLSATDKSLAAEIYGPPANGPIVPPSTRKLKIDGASIEESISTAGEVDVYEFKVDARGAYQAEVDGSAFVRIRLADENKKPLEGFLPADTQDISAGARLPFFVSPGNFTLLVTSSQFLPNRTGDYRIRLRTLS